MFVNYSPSNDKMAAGKGEMAIKIMDRIRPSWQGFKKQDNNELMICALVVFRSMKHAYMPYNVLQRHQEHIEK